MHSLSPSRSFKAPLVAAMIVATALAFAGFIALFGWSGALLALWPSMLIGAGGTLAVVQLSEILSLTASSARR